MIGQLLDLTRARLGGGLRVERRTANLCEIVASAVEEVRAAHPDRTLHWEGSRDTDGEWDADRLAQVVTNLLNNAFQHGAPDTTPEITLLAHGSVVELRVHNEGQPIPPNLQGNLFDAYRRGAELATADGLGLGLFITQQIVKAHGGIIEVRSNAEEGTTFTIRMPRRASQDLQTARGRLELAPA